MNKINPIYIISLVFVLFLFSLSLLSSSKNALNTIESELKELNKLSLEYKEYKNNWFNKEEIEKRVDRLVKSISFKNEKVLVSQSENIIKIKIQSKDEKVLEKFLKRVLNEKFILKKLDVKKDSIYLEIGVKV
ncbi:hypothetical protein CP965_10360 [Halarcobacter mediterraneus]|uniref:Uncharacterized protein n=1 Tax=Halarcobacter mediterraneus TaxID=2023153 RepID=A0A4Q1AW26_9BACT|nr:hypothetical protein [Halarcobacter mediterraneus]RXK12172.1 hypothetical protein CP965_10360 [Halarcobacter mediterraneus]